eukprot:scaffold34177_cov69-Phaeocystis_antarctica.AAC.2
MDTSVERTGAFVSLLCLYFLYYIIQCLWHENSARSAPTSPGSVTRHSSPPPAAPPATAALTGEWAVRPCAPPPAAARRCGPASRRRPRASLCRKQGGYGGPPANAAQAADRPRLAEARGSLWSMICCRERPPVSQLAEVWATLVST